MPPSKQKQAIETLPADVVDGIRTAVSVGGGKVIAETAQRFNVPVRIVRALMRSLTRMPETRDHGADTGKSERVLDVTTAGGIECWRDKFGAAREQALQDAKERHLAWLAARGIAQPNKLEIVPLSPAQQVAESRAWRVVEQRAKAAKKARREAAKNADKVT